jgi:type II restriction enzyme
MPTITPNKIIYQLTVEDLQTVTERFWDFLGGEGAYNELLDCFEQAALS